jgi:hypothetical protein
MQNAYCDLRLTIREENDRESPSKLQIVDCRSEGRRAGFVRGLVFVRGVPPYGLLVLFVTLLVGEHIEDVPLTLHTSVWWATASNATLAMCVALAAFAFVAARAGQPLFGRVLGE